MPPGLNDNYTDIGLYPGGSNTYAHMSPLIPTDFKNPYLESAEASDVDMLRSSFDMSDEQPQRPRSLSQVHDSDSDSKGKKPTARKPKQEEPTAQAGEQHLLPPTLTPNTSSLMDAGLSAPKNRTLLPKPTALETENSTTQTHASSSYGTVAESSSSPTFTRHPFDLGYGKRHTRADSKYEAEKKSSSSANPPVKQVGTTKSRKPGGTNPNLTDMEDGDNVGSVPAPGNARKKRKVEVRVPKSEKSSRASSPSPLGPVSKPASSTKRKTTGKPQSKNTHRNTPTQSTSTSTPTASRSTSSTKASSGKGKSATPTPTSTKGKSKAAPKSNRKSRGLSSANEHSEEEFEDKPGEEHERVSSSRPNTRRSSAQALELEKIKEKQENIRLRLRSQDGEGNAGEE